MSNFVDKIKAIPNLYHLAGCKISDLSVAQKELNIVFPDEFIEYTREFGVISFYGTEWTGLNVDGYLNVVEATKDEKSLNRKFPKGCFVLENLGIDAIITIVDEEGKVYYFKNGKKELACYSISEYLDICIKRKK